MFHCTEIAVIKNRLTERSQTIAVAESVTAGLLQSALASAEEASKYFQGGMTAYNIGQKCRHLNIDPIQAEACNCVSEQMAKDMALNICNVFTNDWGMALPAMLRRFRNRITSGLLTMPSLLKEQLNNRKR